MGWKSKVPLIGGLGLVAIGGVAMAAPVASAASVSGDVVSAAMQQISGDEGAHPFAGQRHHRGMRGQAIAEELGIEVEVYRDAVKAVIADRIADGEERPVWADLTPAERLETRAEFTADVAAELGISADDLQAAHDTVFAAKLAEAVEDGRLTQAEADEMQAAYEDGTLFDVAQDRRIDALGDRLEQLLENGFIDDAQYDALQAELDDKDLRGFHELLREYREANGFEGRWFRGMRGGPAGLDGLGADVAAELEGISL
ncbi:MAG: hypothetical protein O3A10_02165 [Chloroflexi bacterium]|nr:hypothetical protein [Chloroflexota bacterium]MDA1145289.1 hypothetical protein [Chloroflexota bacterium]